MSTIPPYVVFDVETDGYFGPVDRIGLGTKETTWTLKWEGEVVPRARALLARPDVLKVAHNIQFDAPKLRDQSSPVAAPWWDTMLAGHLIEPDMPKALRSMVPLYLDVKPWKHLSEERPAFYNACDVAYTRALFHAQWEVLEDEQMLDYFQHTLMPGVPVLIGQSELGVKVDLEARERLRLYLADYAEDAYTVWYSLCTVDPRSVAKLRVLFYDQMGLKRQYDKDTGELSTAVEALETLRFMYPEHAPLIEALLEIRRVEASTEKYINMKGASRGSVHARFLPGAKDDESESTGLGASSTGRLGASPNMLNVPGEWKHRGRRISREEAMEIRAAGGKVLPPIRSMFVPRRRGDVFLARDESQLELRIIAELSGDEVMKAALNGPLGIHETTRLAIERVSRTPCSKVLAKNFNFLTWYGGTAPSLVSFFRGRGIHITRKQAVDGQTAIRLSYRKAWAWKEEMERRVLTEGWLREPFGRKRSFYGGSRDVNEGLDYKPQATGASILWTQLPLQWALAQQNNCHFPLTIHDEFLHEVPRDGVREYDQQLKELMEMEYPQVGPGFHVPSEAKVGSNWGEMEVLSA